MDFLNIKELIIPEGLVTKIVSAGVTLWEATRYKNWVPYSIDTDGSIYDGRGYKDNSRLSSSGGVSAQSESTTTGFIQAKAGDTIRIKGGLWYNTKVSINYIIAYNSSFSKVYTANSQGGYQTSTLIESMSLDGDVSVVKLKSGLTYEYIRLSINENGITGANLIVTVNEEIT